MRRHRPWPLLVLLVWRQFWGIHCGLIQPIPELPDVKYSRPGDLNLGFVSSMHQYDSSSGRCVPELLSSFQRAEAQIFAVEEINNRTDILPNTTLGFVMVDDCKKELTALSYGLQFIQRTDDQATTSLPWSESLPMLSAVAVIGAETSSSTTQLADLFSVFKIPLLSYIASSTLLDNKNLYSYFSRIIPSDRLQAKAIADLLDKFRWSFVSVLYENNDYGKAGFWMLQQEMEKVGSCFAVASSIHALTDFQDIVDGLISRPEARVVILFLYHLHLTNLFEIILSRKVENYFTWVGSDTVHFALGGLGKFGAVLHGSFMIRFQSVSVKRFEERFQHMTLKTGSHNPWFAEFAAQAFNCSLNPSDTNACNENWEIGTCMNYKPEEGESLAIDAVYALAHALDDLLKTCTEDDVKKCVKPLELRDSLRRVNFIGEGGNISFDDIGNGRVGYEIYNVVYKNKRLEHQNVGIWNPAITGFDSFNKDHITFKPRFRGGPSSEIIDEDGSHATPQSVCSKPCQPGYEMVIGQPHCCFKCVKCKSNERTVPAKVGDIQCQICPSESNFTWPDEETKTKCLPIEPVYQLGIQYPDGVMLLTMCVLTFCWGAATTVLYFINGHTSLIKASGKDLCSIMLFSQLAFSLVTAMYVVPPTDTICQILTFCFPLSFTVMYAPLVVKISRIYRIFLRKSKSPMKLRFISKQSQIALVFGIILVQVLLMTGQVIHLSTKAEHVMHSINMGVVDMECKRERGALWLWALSFNVLLIATCGGLAFKTRNVPDNFNEARFIFITIYITLLLLLAVTPVVIFTEKYITKTIVMCFTLLFNMVLLDVFIFAPKFYAIYLLSEVGQFTPVIVLPTPFGISAQQ